MGDDIPMCKAGVRHGDMIEVEPDVILVAYPESMGEIRPSYIRAQRIRITPEGPVPVAF